MVLPRAASSATWLTRTLQGMADSWKVLTFGLPFISNSTTLTVGRRVLRLHQWSGISVGSGGHLWGGSRRLVNYLEAHGDGSPALQSADGESTGAHAVTSRPLLGLTLLELGSGTGGAGLAAALLGAEVTLSDQASFIYPASVERGSPERTLLDLARLNVERNTAMLLSCALAEAATVSCAITGPSAPEPIAPILPVPLPAVARLLWGDANDHAKLPHAKYDIIAGADLLLFTGAHEGLLRTLRELSSASTVVLIEHTDRGNGTLDWPCDLLHFLDLVAAEGLWRPTVVRDLGRHITIRMVYA